MDQPIFLSQETRRSLEWNDEAGMYIRPQYSGPWFVQIQLPPNRVLAVYHENKLLPLMRDDALGGYRLNTNSKKTERIANKTYDVVGLVQVVIWTGDTDDPGELLSPGLWTIPASLSAEAYREMLDYLKVLAIQLGETGQSLVKESMAGLSDGPSSAVKSTNLSQAAWAAETVLQIAARLSQVWPLISKTPASDLTLETQVLPVHRSAVQRSPQALVRAAMRPDATSVQVDLRNTTHDTQENQFLAFFLQSLIQISEVASTDLDSQRRKLETMLGRPSDDLSKDLPKDLPLHLREKYIQRLTAQRNRLQQDIDGFRALTARLKNVQPQFAIYLNADFLQASRRHAQLPLQPSQKLLRGSGYGPLYKSYQNFSRALDIKGFLRMLQIFERWQEQPVRPIDELYEIWLFLKLYELLMDEFHFTPVGATPFDSLLVSQTGVEIPKDHRFVLEFRNTDDKLSGEILCKVALTYQPRLRCSPCVSGKRCFDVRVCPQLPCYKKIMVKKDWQEKDLTPDISFETLVGKDLKYFIIDAKYRDYKKLCVEKTEMDFYQTTNTFETDLLGIAKIKYYDAPASKVTASFIVHTDPNPKWTFWGGEAITPMPLRESIAGDKEYWPGHAIGSVFATPLLYDNLSILLKSFLIYHTGLFNICWRCGKRLTVSNGGATPSENCPAKGVWSDEKIVQMIESGTYKYSAVYYLCPDCNEFWILQRCFGQKHPILKFGNKSFHSRSRQNPTNPWLNICPKCGSDLPPDIF